MGLTKLVADGGELLYRDEGFSLSLLHRVQRRRLTQTAHRYKGRQQAVFRDLEVCGIGVVNTNGVKMEAPQIKFVAHLQRHQQVLFHVGGVLIVLDLPDFLLHRIHAGAAVLRVEGLGPDGEKRSVEGQRLMHLEPRNTERHHHIGHSVGLREQIADLGQRADIPIRHLMLPHSLLPAVLEALFLYFALTHRLHDLKAHLRLQPHGDQVQHDIIAAAHRLQNAGRAAHDQVPGIAQPHVGTVGEARQPYQGIEILGHGIHQHTAGEPGVELRDSHGAGGSKYLVIFKAQHLGRGENTHGIRVIQGDGPRVHAGQVLQHFDHGGVIVSQHIQLQEVVLHAVILEMSGHGVAVGIVCRVLHRGKILHIHIIRHHHQPTGVLPRSTPHAHAAQRQAIQLRVGGRLAPFLQVFLHHAEGGLFR